VDLVILTTESQVGDQLLTPAGLPDAGIVPEPIQLPYVNRYASVWQYDRDVRDGKIDWDVVLGSRCPVCGVLDCHREITAYERVVIELFPFRRARIQVPRFLCRTRGVTASLLPHQLAPYHQYTIESMVLALLLVFQVCAEDGVGVLAALEELPADSGVTPWLLACWLVTVLRGFRRAHAVLAGWAMLDGLRAARGWQGRLAEVHAYCSAFSPRGPPGPAGLRRLVRRYSATAGRHLVGRPSQDRGRGRPR